MTVVLAANAYIKLREAKSLLLTQKCRENNTLISGLILHGGLLVG